MSNKISIEYISGVTIVRSDTGVPISLMAKLLSKEEKSSVLDAGLSSRIGAIMAFGRKTDIEAFKATNPEPCSAIKAQVAQAKLAHYSRGDFEEIKAYLEGYDRGASADSLLTAITGIRFTKDERTSVPYDSSDLGRCIRLYQSCRLVRDDMSKAKILLQQWSPKMQQDFLVACAADHPTTEQISQPSSA